MMEWSYVTCEVLNTNNRPGNLLEFKVSLDVAIEVLMLRALQLFFAFVAKMINNNFHLFITECRTSLAVLLATPFAPITHLLRIEYLEAWRALR